MNHYYTRAFAATMKVIKHSPQRSQPNIYFVPDGIMIDQSLHRVACLIEKDWQVSSIDVYTLKAWADHPKRQNFPQLITYPNPKIATPEVIDIFWDKQIGVDILPLDFVLRQVEQHISSHQNYQLIIFADNPQATLSD